MFGERNCEEKRGIHFMYTYTMGADHSGSAVLSTKTVFTRSNPGIVGSNPTQGMDVCLRLFCLC
jgi:hypothetical protein